MRPAVLNPFFASLTSLAGVGPKQEKLFQHLLGRGDAPARVVDLLFHLPSGTIDRRRGRSCATWRSDRSSPWR